MARLSSMTPPVLLKVPGALEGLFIVPNSRSSAKSQQRVSGLDVAQPVVNAFRDRSSAYDAGVVKTNRVSYAKTCVATKLGARLLYPVERSDRERCGCQMRSFHDTTNGCSSAPN